MTETRAVKDLAIGDQILVEGFDTHLTVRSAKKVKKGLDAGKLQVTLLTAEGETELMAFDPQERVTIVGPDAPDAKEPHSAKGRTGGKGREKRKGKAKATAERPASEVATPETPAQPLAEAAQAAAAKSPAPKPGRQPQPGAAAKKLSALDAAAQVLAQAGRAMTCPEMIEAMAAQGLWRSPGGKTPAATLYSAILLEQKKKGAAARFRKTDRGQFEATGCR